MKRKHSVGALAMAGALALAACGGGSGDDGGGGPPEQVLTTVEVTSPVSALYSSAPGNTVGLTVTAKDQNGTIMSGLAAPTFTSSNTGVATVNSGGVVTAVAGGTVQLSASVTHGGVTVSGQAQIVVQVPSSIGGVGSSGVPVPSFVPNKIHISAGGLVTWSLSGPEHSVTFVSAGSPANVPSLINASASRNFPVAGTYNYVCDFHPTMIGTVYVH